MCDKLTAEHTSSILTRSHLLQTLPITLDQECNIQEELTALQDVNRLASPVAVDAKAEISVIAHGIAWGVETNELLP